MKITIGLIFIFSVISVSLSSTLRELEFYQSLYPRDGIPRSLIISVLNRRSNQTKDSSEKESIPEDAKAFYNSTYQALQLLLDSVNENNYRINTIINYYSNIVEPVEYVDKHLKIPNVDYVNVRSQKSLPRDQLQALMDAYIDDIDLLSQLSSVHKRQVDEKTVDRLKSLSNDLRNYNIYRDDRIRTESISISRKALDQYLWQLDFLLNKFVEFFQSHSI